MPLGISGKPGVQTQAQCLAGDHVKYQTNVKRQQETDRAQSFHKRVTIVIVCGFALIVVTASILAMVVS